MYPAEHFRDVLGLMTVEELCEAIGVTKQTLAKWRVIGQGPHYTRLGKSVFYRYVDVVAWINESVHEPGRLPHNTNAKDPADQIDLEELIDELDEGEQAAQEKLDQPLKAPEAECTTASASSIEGAGVTTEVTND